MLTTFSKKGRNILQSVKKLNSEDEKTIGVPEPKNLNNPYFVDLMVCRNWECHTPLMGTSLHLFSTAENVENPSQIKPLLFERIFHLTFPSITALKKLSTTDDLTVSFRENKLENYAIAQVIHKWNRLNAYPRPSLSKKWWPRRSYATAVRNGTNIKLQITNLTANITENKLFSRFE